jgi:hypothetical protein
MPKRFRLWHFTQSISCGTTFPLVTKFFPLEVWYTFFFRLNWKHQSFDHVDVSPEYPLLQNFDFFNIYPFFKCWAFVVCLTWVFLVTMQCTFLINGGFRGGARGPGPPLFAQNLPSYVSKTQNLRPKIREFFCNFGGWAPLLGAGPPFSKFLDPPLLMVQDLWPTLWKLYHGHNF